MAKWPISQRAADLAKGNPGPSKGFLDQVAAQDRVKRWGKEWQDEQAAKKAKS